MKNQFFPITALHPEYLALKDFKKSLYGNKEYDFSLLYNARNIRRKCVPDLMLAWKIFVDELPEDKARKCALVLHTQVVDENGTDLQAVKICYLDMMTNTTLYLIKIDMVFKQ
jgi:hypothetical protein